MGLQYPLHEIGSDCNRGSGGICHAFNGRWKLYIRIGDAKGDVSDSSIDITRAWTSIEGGNFVVHLQVAGNIDREHSMYVFTLEDGSNSVGVTYSNGGAFYTAISSAGMVSEDNINVDGNTLTIKLPSSFTSGLDYATTSFKVVASSGNGEMDYAYSTGENENGGENNGSDPTKENPTDASIKVKINNVRYRIEKLDDNSAKIYIYIDGTTSGVDHAAINFVVFYKNGTHSYGSWITPTQYNGSYGGYSINIFFNSTKGNWEKWKFEMNATYPLSQYEWLHDVFEGKSRVSKFSVYVRAYKDKEEQKWNQDSYDTVPNFSATSITYGMGGSTSHNNEGGNNGESKEKGKTPGFELAMAAMAIIAIALMRKRRN